MNELSNEQRIGIGIAILLIIGLIIFAKNAPEIITTSLSLPKGNMSLGIGKKLADGGAYAAGGVAGAGVTSAVRNWRSEGKGWRKPISAIAGMGSGMARAAFNQFGPGPGRKPAMTFGDMKNVAESNAQKTTNAKQARDERLTELAAAKKDLERVLADPSATEEQIAAARQRVTAATAYGAALDDIGKKIDAWSTASVSTAVEEAKKLVEAAKAELQAAVDKKADAAEVKSQIDKLDERVKDLEKINHDYVNADAQLKAELEKAIADAVKAAKDEIQLAIEKAVNDLEDKIYEFVQEQEELETQISIQSERFRKKREELQQENQEQILIEEIQKVQVEVKPDD